jgi:hypothetical protein
VWIKNRWVAYPFQNNVSALPKEDQVFLTACIPGLTVDVHHPDPYTKGHPSAKYFSSGRPTPLRNKNALLNCQEFMFWPCEQHASSVTQQPSVTATGYLCSQQACAGRPAPYHAASCRAGAPMCATSTQQTARARAPPTSLSAAGVAPPQLRGGAST